MPSCATLASSALRRCFIEVRSWRCHTQRTPAGEIDNPRRFSASATRTWPQAGCSIASSTTASSISIGVRFFSIGLRRLISCNASSPFVVQLLEPVEAVAAVPHHLASVAHIAELLGQFEQTDLRPDDLLFLCHIVISVPPAGGSRSQLGVRTATRPPAPFGKPTTTVRLNASIIHLSLSSELVQ